MKSTLSPAVGDRIILDNKAISERLLPGDTFSDSGYPGCEFRFPRYCTVVPSVAINIRITGRKIIWRQGENMIRIRIEWVGDCEPSTFSGGWLVVP